MTEIWWERRRDGEPTPNYLGRVLDECGGLGDMPRRAREAHFDDFFCPPEVATGFEIMQLVIELDQRRRKLGRKQREKVHAIIVAVKDGEFDATEAESQRWMASADGQAALRALAAP